MKKTLASLIAATASAAILMTSMQSAQAHDIHIRHYHQHQPYYGHHNYDPYPYNYLPEHKHRHHKKKSQPIAKHNNGGDAVVWGIIGLAAGAIIAGSLNKQQRPTNIKKPTTVYPGANHYPPAPTRAYQTSHTSYEPWSSGWYNYCKKRFKTFNASTGTYRGYDGKDHFCIVR